MYPRDVAEKFLCNSAEVNKRLFRDMVIGTRTGTKLVVVKGGKKQGGDLDRTRTRTEAILRVSALFILANLHN